MPAPRREDTMFPEPPRTLADVLQHALDNPDPTRADLRFTFNTDPPQHLMAHRALIHARTTSEFRARYMPALDNDSFEPDIVITVSLAQNDVHPEVFRNILRYWYTGALANAMDVLMTDFGAAALASSGSSATAEEGAETEGCDGIGVKIHEVVQTKNGLQYRSQHASTSTSSIEPSTPAESVRLAEDLLTLWKEGTYSDIELTIQPPSRPASPSSSLTKPSSKKTKTEDMQLAEQPPTYRAHKFLLAAHSPYFSAMFSSPFLESHAMTLPLPRETFTPQTLTSFLHFLYTGRLPQSSQSTLLKPRLAHLDRLHHAGDYFAMPTTLCAHTAHHLAVLCHGFTCYRYDRCDRCQQSVPAVLILADRHRHTGTLEDLRDACLRVLSDPARGPHSMWPNRAVAEFESGLRDEVLSRTVERVVPTNAVDALQSAHLLDRALETHAGTSWSRAIRTTMFEPLLDHAAMLVTTDFHKHVVESSTLRKCVDGVGFSFDFLEFLLARVVEKLVDANVGKVYQALVRDLMARKAVRENGTVGEVLERAREGCVAYVKRRWVGVKAAGGLEGVEDEVLWRLAEGWKDEQCSRRAGTILVIHHLNSLYPIPIYLLSPLRLPPPPTPNTETSVPLENLTNTTASSNVFHLNGFSPRSARSRDDQLLAGSGSGSAGSTSRPKGSGGPRAATRSAPRPGSSATASPLSAISTPPPPPSSSATRRQPRAVTTSAPSTASASVRATPPRPVNGNISTPARRGPASSATPVRSQQVHRTTSAGRAATSVGVAVGSSVGVAMRDRVRLPKRGDGGLATVRFVGTVQFAEGTWVGVEVDSGEGKNDGSVQGVRYFDVANRRGVFVKATDVVLVAEGGTSADTDASGARTDGDA
ncbi:hypothetical protein BC936DRAFT_146786 [Jimgerdemannia flammicorona]|uniref:BTB domain-containing protein n=1 Tax=Jimgerdemannia flammicorona TaxID=994334 RepID=A0A433D6R6_9FUNG|nr:hypothetical protein BC936DRAFT_146786 [Jimgerdemannia flammicorona]